jgi:hypothetical protein
MLQDHWRGYTNTTNMRPRTTIAEVSQPAPLVVGAKNQGRDYAPLVACRHSNHPLQQEV